MSSAKESTRRFGWGYPKFRPDELGNITDTDRLALALADILVPRAIDAHAGPRHLPGWIDRLRWVPRNNPVLRQIRKTGGVALSAVTETSGGWMSAGVKLTRDRGSGTTEISVSAERFGPSGDGAGVLRSVESIDFYGNWNSDQLGLHYVPTTDGRKRISVGSPSVSESVAPTDAGFGDLLRQASLLLAPSTTGSESANPQAVSHPIVFDIRATEQRRA